MIIKEWLVAHLPPWLNPFGLYGERGRPEMPDKHAVVNKQQELSLRLDRLEQRARSEAAARRTAEAWADERD